MHIGLIIKDYAIGEKFSKNGIPTKSGAEFHAEHHAKALIALGHKVTIFAKKRSFSAKSTEVIDGVHLVRLHEPFRGGELFLRLMTTHRDIDTFYILGRPAFAVWAILYSRVFHKPATLALTGIAESFDPHESWRNRVFTKCSQYLAISRAIQSSFVERSGIFKEKVIVQPQGLDTVHYAQVTDAQKRKLRKEHRLPEDALVLLFCARVVLNKGTDTLETAWKRIHAKFPQARLLIVGGGQKDLLQEMQILSKTLGNSIVVVGEVSDTCPYYQLSDVYIFPSRHEGLPNTLMEAMSTGLPAVASNIGGCEDLIKAGENGYLVATEDPDAFAEKVELLFSDDRLRKRLGTAAADFVRKHLDIKDRVRELEEVLSRPFS